MTTKASMSAGYRWRLGIIALACLGFSAWFFYDAAVAYPKKQEIHDTYLQLQADDPQHYNSRWVELARREGWSVSPPKPFTDMDILTQYIFGALVLPVGLAFLWAFARSTTRWISADEQGLHTSWGVDVPWDSIRAINKDRWHHKGIAVVHYELDGAPRRLTLDDWKYEREPTGEMVARVDEHLGLTPSAEDEAAMTPAQREAEELAS